VSELASESSGEAAAPGRASPILLYHSVADRPSDFIAPYTVSPAIRTTRAARTSLIGGRPSRFG
jgi:hypothetical protein